MNACSPSSGIPFPRRDELLATLSARNQARMLDEAILAPTDVILPSGATVVAVIEGGRAGSEITITDAGMILTDLADTGASITDMVRKAFKKEKRKQGFNVKVSSQLRLGPISIDDAAPALVLFANGARKVAEAITDAVRKSSREHFRERVRGELDRIFSANNVRADSPLQGKSTRNHKFDYLITLPAGRRLVLDVPMPDQTSVASAVLRQVDIRAAGLPRVGQAIAYDERDGLARILARATSTGRSSPHQIRSFRAGHRGDCRRQ